MVKKVEEKVKKEENKKIDFRSYLNNYEFSTELPGSGESVTFRPITTGQLKRLLVYENEENPIIIEEALDELISTSITDKKFDINELYLQDRFFLLVEIRRKSKGDMYMFQYTCKECRNQTLHKINLTDLKVKKLSKDLDNVVSIYDELSVRLEHTKRGSQKIAYNALKDRPFVNENLRATEMAVATHATSIIGIITPDGEITDSTFEDRKYLLENIPAEKYVSIRKWFEDNDFGISFKYDIKCRDCGNVITVDIPVDNFFF